MDFNKLREKKTRSVVTDPVEIFRRLPKPEGINDLYTSQAEVLNAWFANRQAKDTILKLHTGGGKTLVGLLIGQSSLNETGEPVLYLVPTVQLVRQTIEKANALGIPAVPYVKGEPLNGEFINGKAIMVATYKALFNGRSKFGLRGSVSPQNVSTIILDDAHAAFSVVRESFTIEIPRDNDMYSELSNQFRQAFGEVDKLGTFDDIVSNKEYAILEVPYWAWHQKLNIVREILKSGNDCFGFEWTLLRDQLHLCHALISRRSFTITPVQPLVNLFPTFFDAPHRIYMSATIADDSDIVRTFDVDPSVANTTLSSRSLAGISERMILIPDLMPCKPDLGKVLKALFDQTTSANLGAIVLTASDQKAQQWEKIATPVTGTADVEKKVAALQEKKELGPFVFSNRYDGMDLPGDSCRLLVLSGLPSGSSNYELFKASALYGAKTITKMMAQRIEQGIGRGSRGAGDYCVVILTGTDLSGWISKKTNFAFLTSSTKAQLEIGTEISKEVADTNGIISIVQQCYNRDKDWIEYHAESLAELTDSDSQNIDLLGAGVERKAINLWQDGHYEKAIKTIDKYLEKNDGIDNQTKGWLIQLSARIADNWGNKKLADDKQQEAYALNKNLIRPKILPPYRPQPRHQSQSEEIVHQINKYRDRRGFLKTFEENVSFLNSNSSANQFERSLCELAKMIGIYAERHDDNGEGPDVLWLLPDKVGFVIEAKSRKKEQNALTKEEHGQLLVADEWFMKNYPEYRSVRISVHPTNQATKVAEAGGSYALTYRGLESLISDARAVLTKLCESKLETDDLVAECDSLLEESNIRHDKITNAYLCPFEETK